MAQGKTRLGSKPAASRVKRQQALARRLRVPQGPGACVPKSEQQPWEVTAHKLPLHDGHPALGWLGKPGEETPWVLGDSSDDCK